MSLMDMDDMRGAVREAARVLEPGGRLCLAVEHPINSAGRFAGQEPESPFLIRGSYLEPRHGEEVHERDGIRITFASVTGPLEWYLRALEEAGLLVEALREPRPDADFVADHPSMARWGRVPMFLLARAM